MPKIIYNNQYECEVIRKNCKGSVPEAFMISYIEAGNKIVKWVDREYLTFPKFSELIY